MKFVYYILDRICIRNVGCIHVSRGPFHTNTYTIYTKIKEKARKRDLERNVVIFGVNMIDLGQLLRVFSLENMNANAIVE
jgi:hypothetical protein